MSTRTLPDDLQASLRTSIAVSTAPYGYTLTVWGSGAAAITQLGSPSLPDVLLFMAGAVVSFLTLEALAYGSVALRVISGPPPTVTVWGSAHWLSAGIAILAVWGIDHLVHGLAGWALAGLLATALYLVLNALQVGLARQGSS